MFTKLEFQEPMEVEATGNTSVKQSGFVAIETLILGLIIVARET